MIQQENDNRAILEDLPVADAQADEVRGGSPRSANTGALRNVNSTNTW
jgi:hypothetical protein